MVFNRLLRYVYLLNTLCNAAHLNFSKSDIRALLEPGCWRNVPYNMVVAVKVTTEISTNY